MRGEARAMLIRVEALKQHHFVLLHMRKIKPSMLGVVGEYIYFADPVAIDEIVGHQVSRCNGLRIAHRERIFLDRPANRTPYVDDGEAMLQQLVSLIGK